MIADPPFQAVFHYPPFRFDSPKYTAHHGHVVHVTRLCTDEEYDYEGELLYRIECDAVIRGWHGVAFESELIPVDNQY